MGCYAAIPALATVADAARARGSVGILACVELTSLHLQPAGLSGDRDADREQMVAHALFSDAAAAVAVTPATDGGPGLDVLGFTARTLSDAAELMTWDVTDLGFRMGLSPRVPRVLAGHVVDAVDELCARHGLSRDAVQHWVVHPGGPRIIDVVADQLDIDEQAVAASRATLADHGNCSSATVLLILDRLRRSGAVQAGDHVIALAFGPGLTLYATLLRAHR
jgi:predicted naringenin-chalcone synthase